jgi:hypothetical protein
MALLVVPAISAVSIGSGVGIDIVTEDFEPMVWMCDNRAVIDDNTEPGRLEWSGPVFTEDEETCECIYEECITQCGSIATSWDFECNGLPCDLDFSLQQSSGLDCLTWCEQQTLKFDCPVYKGEELVERKHNYAFEGEKIEWVVLVMDKNGVEKLEDVFATIGDVQGPGNDIEVNCNLIHGYAAPGQQLDETCNARILEEELTQFDPDTMAYYECTLTVETPESMYGEYWITVEALDLDGLSGTMDENEYWFLNPEIALSIEGDLVFEDVRPGVHAYSETMLIGNDADDGSGVMLDMFISGTDFYDSSSSGAKCPYTNQLLLGDGDSICDNDDPFCYFASHGAYSTSMDIRSDEEGYVGIDYGIGFHDPNLFYDNNEIMQVLGPGWGGYYYANILSPGDEMAVTFRLNLPEPCNGDFD